MTDPTLTGKANMRGTAATVAEGDCTWTRALVTSAPPLMASRMDFPASVCAESPLLAPPREADCACRETDHHIWWANKLVRKQNSSVL